MYKITDYFRKFLSFKIDSSTVCLVTGGSRGLGLEIVKILRRKEATVIIVDINPPIDSISKPEKVFYYKCNIANHSEVQNLYYVLKSKHIQVNVLINNASIKYVSPLKEMSNAIIDDVIQTNLLGMYVITSIFLEDILSGKGGFIVNITSILGCITPARLSTYGASKAGQITFHQGLSQYIKDFNRLHNKTIGTLLVCTGKLDTDMFKDVVTPSRVFAPDVCPKKLAKKIVESIETGQLSVIKEPFYTSAIDSVNSLEWSYRTFIKNISGMNNSTNI